MRCITLLILTFLSITSYAQTIINVDSSNTVNIYNNGTLIENNQGTVNIGTEIGKEEELRMPDDLGKVTEPKDKKIHFIYTDDYKFAGDKVKIKDKVYNNVDIPISISDRTLFEINGNNAYYSSQRMVADINLDGFDTYTKGNLLYVSKYKNCNDEYEWYYMTDDLSPWTVYKITTVGGVVVSYESRLEVLVFFLIFTIFMAIITIIFNRLVE